MADKQKLPEETIRAIELAVQTTFGTLDVVSLKKCQEELMATRHDLATMQQNFEVWRKLAELHGNQSEQRGSQIDELQQMVTRLQAEIALLRSTIENMGPE